MPPIALDQLDCKIYVESSLRLEELARRLSTRVQAILETTPTAAILRLPFAEVEIHKNQDACSNRVAEFPDGFLYFRYRVEVYVDQGHATSEKIDLVSEVLKHCWDSAWPAVAACDYEQELPERGGINSHSIPWPETAVGLRA